jgi:hypothetical protein
MNCLVEDTTTGILVVEVMYVDVVEEDDDDDFVDEYLFLC